MKIENEVFNEFLLQLGNKAIQLKENEIIDLSAVDLDESNLEELHALLVKHAEESRYFVIESERLKQKLITQVKTNLDQAEDFIEPLLPSIQLLRQVVPSYRDDELEINISLFFADQAKSVTDWEDVDELYQQLLEWQILVISGADSRISPELANSLGTMWNNLSLELPLECDRKKATVRAFQWYAEFTQCNDISKLVESNEQLVMIERFGSLSPNHESLQQAINVEDDSDVETFNAVWQQLLNPGQQVNLNKDTALALLAKNRVNLLNWLWFRILPADKKESYEAMRNAAHPQLSDDMLKWLQTNSVSESIEGTSVKMNISDDQKRLHLNLKQVINLNDQQAITDIITSNLDLARCVLQKDNFKLLKNLDVGLLSHIVYLAFFRLEPNYIQAEHIVTLINSGDTQIANAALTMSHVITSNMISHILDELTATNQKVFKQALTFDKYASVFAVFNESAVDYMLKHLFDIDDYQTILATRPLNLNLAFKVLNTAYANTRKISKPSFTINPEQMLSLLDSLIPEGADLDPDYSKQLNVLFSQQSYQLIENFPCQLNADINLKLSWLIEHVFTTNEEREYLFKINYSNTMSRLAVVIELLKDVETNKDRLKTLWNELPKSSQGPSLNALFIYDCLALRTITKNSVAAAKWVLDELIDEENCKKWIYDSRAPEVIQFIATVRPEAYATYIANKACDYEFAFKTIKENETAWQSIWDMMSSTRSCNKENGFLYKVVSSKDNNNFSRWLFKNFLTASHEREKLWETNFTHDGIRMICLALVSACGEEWLKSERCTEAWIHNQLLKIYDKPENCSPEDEKRAESLFNMKLRLVKLNIPKLSRAIAANIKVTDLLNKLIYYTVKELVAVEFSKIFDKLYSNMDSRERDTTRKLERQEAIKSFRIQKVELRQIMEILLKQPAYVNNNYAKTIKLLSLYNWQSLVSHKLLEKVYGWNPVTTDALSLEGNFRRLTQDIKKSNINNESIQLYIERLKALLDENQDNQTLMQFEQSGIFTCLTWTQPEETPVASLTS